MSRAGPPRELGEVADEAVEKSRVADDGLDAGRDERERNVLRLRAPFHDARTRLDGAARHIDGHVGTGNERVARRIKCAFTTGQVER